MALGMGYCLGPAIATIAIRWFGYLGTNMFFAAIMFIFGGGGVFSMPARINKAPKSEHIGFEGESDSIPYTAFLTNKWSLMAILAKPVATICV